MWQLPTEFTERLSNPNELAKLASSPDEFEKFFNDNNEQVSPTGINSAKDDNKVGKKNPLKPLEGLYDQTAQNVSHARIGNQYNRERDGVLDFLYLGIYENYQYQYSIRRDPNTGELGLYLSGLLRKPGSDVATEFEEKVENPSPDLVRRVEAALNEINADAKKQIQHNRRRFEEIQRQFPEMK